MSGAINLVFDTIASAAPHIKSGKLRASAVVDLNRSSALPEVPTLTELKYPKATFEAWYGVAAAVGTPAAVLQTLSQELAAIMALPEVKEKLHAAGLEATFLGAEAFTAKVQTETAAYAAVGKRVNITME